MHDDEGGPIIHSWRDVFTHSWRIHSFLGWRPNIPGGIDGIMVIYFIVAALVVGILGYLPGIGTLIAVGPWPFAHIVLPAYFAMIATMATPDDRSALRYRAARIRMWFDNLNLPAFAPHPERIPVLDDGTGAGLAQPGQVAGPAHIEFTRPVRLRYTKRAIIARPDPDGETGPVVLTDRNVTLQVRR